MKSHVHAELYQSRKIENIIKISEANELEKVNCLNGEIDCKNESAL